MNIPLFHIFQRAPDAARFQSNINGRCFSLARGYDGWWDLIELFPPVDTDDYKKANWSPIWAGWKLSQLRRAILKACME